MAREDLPPVELPLQRSPQEVAIPREETSSSRLFLEAEINQFHLEEEGEAQDRPVELSNSEADFDRSFATHPLRLVVDQVDTSSEEEEEMALNPRRGLKYLVARRKGSSSKDAPQTKLPSNPPYPLGLHRDPNLQRKKWKGKDIKEGEILPPKDPKQQKTAKDRRASSVESKEDPHGAKMRRQQHTWSS